MGAFVGASIVMLVYYPALKPDVNAASLFTTFPAVPGFLPGFIDQVVGSALLLFLILAIVDYYVDNDSLTPLLVGLLIVAFGCGLSGMHGYALNPARDLSPRLLCWLMGVKNTGFDGIFGTWLVPVTATPIGAVVGALLYDKTLGAILRRAR